MKYYWTTPLPSLLVGNLEIRRTKSTHTQQPVRLTHNTEQENTNVIVWCSELKYNFDNHDNLFWGVRSIQHNQTNINRPTNARLKLQSSISKQGRLGSLYIIIPRDQAANMNQPSSGLQSCTALKSFPSTQEQLVLLSSVGCLSQISAHSRNMPQFSDPARPGLPSHVPVNVDLELQSSVPGGGHGSHAESGTLLHSGTLWYILTFDRRDVLQAIGSCSNTFQNFWLLCSGSWLTKAEKNGAEVISASVADSWQSDTDVMQPGNQLIILRTYMIMMICSLKLLISDLMMIRDHRSHSFTSPALLLPHFSYQSCALSQKSRGSSCFFNDSRILVLFIFRDQEIKMLDIGNGF